MVKVKNLHATVTGRFIVKMNRKGVIWVLTLERLVV